MINKIMATQVAKQRRQEIKMANATRMRINSNAQIFHRVPADNDMATHDFATSDSAVASLGGSGDFQLESDATVSYGTLNFVQDSTEQTLQAANSTTEKTIGATGFIHIKNTGFTSSSKDTAVASGSYITIGMAASPAFATAGFTLSAGESICLHGLGAGSDQFSQLSCDSSVAATYVEIVYLESSA